MAILEGIIVATTSCSIALSDEALVDCEQALSELSDYCALIETSEMGDSTYVIPGGLIDDAEHPVVDNEGHSCAGQKVDIIAICEENYRFVRSYYDSMLVMQMTDPTFNAWLATVSLWISRVRENGAWDYKVSTEFGPYNNVLCAYYNGRYNHITAEYFGNFNYGYTGSILFSLELLHFGSSAVSGFDAADKSDWPAIDAGYYFKTE